MIKKIRADKYLKKFVDYCKNKFKDNLIGIVIYGSYAWGYFDKRKSDYDVFVIFKDKKPNGRKEIEGLFPKISLQYFCTANDLKRIVREGHFAPYITLLKSAKILYAKPDYQKFLKELSKINFLEEMLDTVAYEWKAKYERNVLLKAKSGFKAAKWALPVLRKRLQLLALVRKRRLVWDLKKVLILNKDLLTKEERDFIADLDKKVIARSRDFDLNDKKMALRILGKIDRELLLSLVGAEKLA